MGAALWFLLMLRRKLQGAAMLPRLRWLDAVGALGLAVHVLAMRWHPAVIAAAWAVFPLARVAVRDYPPRSALLPLAVLALTLIVPMASLSGIGLGVFLVMSRRGADPLARGTGQALLCLPVAFAWLVAHPPLVQWQPMAFGIASALAFASFLALQRRIGSSGS
ncbi:hypothetical protein QCN27_02600 [Cereibacter sp. SYSU M97828]|nr:hypothetical protein [Cereibacter flavus]